MSLADELAEVCRRHNAHPISVLLLWRWRDTPDGQRFMAGGSLNPQFGPPTHTQAWARMSLDWAE